VKAEEYGRAGILMLPSVKAADRTRREILFYILPRPARFDTVAHRLLPGLWRFALVLGGLMLVFSARVYAIRTGPKVDRCAMQLFGFSILSLFLLFAEIPGERVIAISTSNLGVRLRKRLG